MGVVYSALDEQNARRVAIKVMMTDLEGDPETLNVEDFWDLGPLQAALEAEGS